jgi:hypothetical protein
MSSTAVSASSETWTATIPAQAAGEVYFYLHANPYVHPSMSSAEYDPSGLQIHYAYAVQ